VLFLHESPSLAVWLGIVLAVVGIGIVVARTLSGDRSKIGLRGVLFGLASVVSMSVSIITPRKRSTRCPRLRRRLSACLRNDRRFPPGRIHRAVGAWMNPFRRPPLGRPVLIAVIIVTFGGSGYRLVAIKYADVCVANTLISTEPVFVLPLSVIFLREKITCGQPTGTLIAVAESSFSYAERQRECEHEGGSDGSLDARFGNEAMYHA